MITVKMGKNLRNILLGAGMIATAWGLLPDTSQGQNLNVMKNNGNNTINTINHEENKSVDKNKTFYISKDGSQDWDGETRHWHVTPKGDTIVSYLNQEQADEFEEKMERSVPSDSKDPPEDPQDPRWGLNGYVSAYDTNYQTNTDWYGSGDIDGDGAITWDDYFSTVSGTDPFNDGTYRGDVNLDGVTESSEFSQDKQIIYEY